MNKEELADSVKEVFDEYDLVVELEIKGIEIVNLSITAYAGIDKTTGEFVMKLPYEPVPVFEEHRSKNLNDLEKLLMRWSSKNGYVRDSITITKWKKIMNQVRKQLNRIRR
jgi:hypothetical protein